MSDEMSPWQVTSVRGCGTLEVSEYDFRGIRGCVISFETEVGPVSFDRQGAENRVSLCDRNRHNASKTAEKRADTADALGKFLGGSFVRFG